MQSCKSFSVHKKILTHHTIIVITILYCTDKITILHGYEHLVGNGMRVCFCMRCCLIIFWSKVMMVVGSRCKAIAVMLAIEKTQLSHPPASELVPGSNVFSKLLSISKKIQLFISDTSFQMFSANCCLLQMKKIQLFYLLTHVHVFKRLLAAWSTIYSKKK